MRVSSVRGHGIWRIYGCNKGRRKSQDAAIGGGEYDGRSRPAAAAAGGKRLKPSHCRNCCNPTPTSSYLPGRGSLREGEGGGTRFLSLFNNFSINKWNVRSPILDVAKRNYRPYAVPPGSRKLSGGSSLSSRAGHFWGDPLFGLKTFPLDLCDVEITREYFS